MTDSPNTPKQKRLVHENGAVCLGGPQCSRLVHFFPEELESKVVHDVTIESVGLWIKELEAMKIATHTAAQLCKSRPEVHLLKIATVLISGAERALQCILNGKGDLDAAGNFIGAVITDVGRTAGEIK